MSLWQPTFDNVIANLIAICVVYLLARAYKSVINLGSLAASFNDQWGLRVARRDLAQLRACIDDRNEIFRFALIRAGFWMTTLSSGLMFATLALIGHAIFVAPIVFFHGLGLYLIAVQSTGMVYWAREPEKFVPILEARIERIQAKIASRSTRRNDGQAA